MALPRTGQIACRIDLSWPNYLSDLERGTGSLQLCTVRRQLSFLFGFATDKLLHEICLGIKPVQYDNNILDAGQALEIRYIDNFSSHFVPGLVRRLHGVPQKLP